MSYYSFREVFEIEDLLPLFKLRYQIYNNEEETTKQFLTSNKQLVDIDAYDMNARHFGLYHVKKNKETLVGTSRLIYEFEGKCKESILGFIEEHQELKLKINLKPRKPLYMLEIDNGKAISNFYNAGKKKNYSFSECSRICVSKPHRNLKTIIFLIRCIMTAHLFDGVSDVGFVSTSKKNMELYLRFLDMVPIPDTDYIIGNHECIVLKIQKEMCTLEKMSIFNELNRELMNKNEITLINKGCN